MANLDPQVQIKLMEISRDWARGISDNKYPSPRPSEYPEEFDKVYKQLVKTVSAG